MFVLVVPCFNEEKRWSREYWRSVQSVDGVSWLIVNDGSTDATPDLAMDAGLSSRWRVLTLPSNVGKGEAIRAGFRDALSSGGVDGVGFMDADGAFAKDDVQRLCTLARDFFTDDLQWDAVWSSRVMLAGRRIRRSPWRHYLGRIVATYLSVGRAPLPYDTQSGLKFFAPSSALASCVEEPFTTRWLFELELMARWLTVEGQPMRIWEEPLHSWSDVPDSKIRGMELVRVARELAMIRKLGAGGTGAHPPGRAG